MTAATSIWTGRRRQIGWAAAALLGLGVATALLSPPTTRTYLDPVAATPGGTRAVAEILREGGVSVERSTSAERVLGLAASTEGSTVVVAYPELLDAEALADLAEVPADVVLLGAPAQVPAYLGVTPVAPTDVQSREPQCDLNAATSAGAAVTGGVTYQVSGEQSLGSAPPPALCYPSGTGATVVQVTTAAGFRQTVLGSADFMTNDQLADEGNAALALNLLGGRPKVIWWLPTPEFAGTQPLTSLLPDGVWPILGALAMTVLVTAAWQGRRLGPVVVEPLPVAVRASETTEGRAQMYQRHQARDRAAEHLREHTRARLKLRNGLPAACSDAALATATAHVTGRRERDVHDLLYGPGPESDDALVTLAQQLSTLEQEAGRR